jgi:hypothetical protein
MIDGTERGTAGGFFGRAAQSIGCTLRRSVCLHARFGGSSGFDDVWRDSASSRGTRHHLPAANLFPAGRRTRQGDFAVPASLDGDPCTACCIMPSAPSRIPASSWGVTVHGLVRPPEDFPQRPATSVGGGAAARELAQPFSGLTAARRCILHCCRARSVPRMAVVSHVLPPLQRNRPPLWTNQFPTWNISALWCSHNDPPPLQRCGGSGRRRGKGASSARGGR